LLGFAWFFIRPIRGFSMGYGEKNKKNSSCDRQAFRQTCGFYPAIWPGDLAM
jgi:hypothetical protein